MKRKVAVIMSAVLLMQPCIQAYGLPMPIDMIDNMSAGSQAIATNSNADKEVKGSEKASDANAAVKTQAENGETIRLVRGESIQLEVPEDFVGEIAWSTTTGFNNVGADKIKRPLKEGEVDGTRSYGMASANHLATVDQKGLVKAIAKGNGIKVIAKDKEGRQKEWTIDIRYYSEDELIKGTKEDYQSLRNKYVETLVGSNNDMTDPAVEKFVKTIDENAKLWWDSYAYKGDAICASIPWEADLTLKGVTCDIPTYLTDAVRFRVTYQHVEAMAKAYATTGSQYYQNKELLKDVIAIMDWLTENCYYPRSQTDNWWTWEIGLPKQLFPICLYIYDELDKVKLGDYVRAFEIMQPDPFHEGIIGTASTHAQGYREATAANRMDCAYSAIGLGLVLEDGEYLSLASEAAASTMTNYQKPILNDDGTYSLTDGFYEDGSYIDHGKVPYVASYGVELLGGSINIINLLGRTPWTLNDDNLNMLQTYVTKGYIPAVYKGAALDMLRGRAIARPDLSDRQAGLNITVLLVKLLDVVDAETAKIIKGNVKYWLTEDTISGNLEKITDLGVLSKVKSILSDETINTEVANEAIHNIYPLMDRTIHKMDNYLFGISMYSSRIQNCEVMNSENLHGWFTGSGMTYLYNQDLDQYTNNYWNTIDPYKLPGTTVVPVDIGNGTPDGTGFYQSGDFLSPEDWVGGTSIGNYGVSGMALNGTPIPNGDKSNPSSSKYADNLRAKKSYFMFEDEIVCLGAGITNKDSGDLETMTTVENRKIKDDKSNLVLIDGKEFVGDAQEEVTPKWMHMQGNTQEGSDIGYYFPEVQKLQISKTERTGSWRDIKFDLNENYPSATKNYLECWFEHGTEPLNKTYSYVLLPDKSAAQTEQYAKNPSSVIIENSDKVQAVKNTKLDILAANFWTEDTVSVEGLTVTGQASVMLKKEGNQLKVAVSDPTMLNTGKVLVKISGQKGIKVTSSDKNVTVKLNDNTIDLVIDVNGKCGFSSYAQIELVSKDTTDPGDNNKPEYSDTDSSVTGNVSNVSGDWSKEESGWRFKNKDGSYITNSWIMVDSKWYYLNTEGYMSTGWIQSPNGSWYYLAPDGAMATGWVLDANGKWYYMNYSGEMKSGWNMIKDTWYCLDNSGAMSTGWIQGNNGSWYYMEPSGAMKVNGWIDGYFVDRNGIWSEGNN